MSDLASAIREEGKNLKSPSLTVRLGKYYRCTLFKTQVISTENKCP